LSTTRTLQSFRAPQYFVLFSAITLLSAITPFVAAQNVSEAASTSSSPFSSSSTLPDAPGEPTDVPASSSSLQSPDGSPHASNPSLSQSRGLSRFLIHSDTVVFVNETPPPLTARQKVVLGMKGSVSPFSVAGWITSAGWSQLRNSAPNYGTDGGAYGQRLGATALRNVSQNIFGNSILAPILHEDPRYYEMGRGHNFFKRSVYAASRVLVTRTDSGHATPNYALVGGNLAGAALTNAYYPTINQGFSQTAMNFGTSLGGSAIGMVLSEFYDDALQIVHLKKNE
jgi:hypothetical protein